MPSYPKPGIARGNLKRKREHERKRAHKYDRASREHRRPRIEEPPSVVPTFELDHVHALMWEYADD